MSGDCPDPCSYGVTIQNGFTGGNQWIPNIGGVTVPNFTSIVPTADGVVFAMVGNRSTLYFYDAAVNQTWMSLASNVAVTSIFGNSLDYFMGLYNAGIYKYNWSTQQWAYYASASGYSNFTSPMNGYIFATNATGKVYYYYDYYHTWTYFGPALSGMTSMSVGWRTPGSWSVNQGGFFITAKANNHAYVLNAARTAWVQIDVGFTPASIMSGSDMTVAIDTAGNLRRLETFNQTSATWTNLGTAPTGQRTIAIGGPADVIVYGNSNVQRFLPNANLGRSYSSAANISTGIGGYMTGTLPNGQQFRGNWFFQCDRCMPTGGNSSAYSSLLFILGLLFLRRTDKDSLESCFWFTGLHL